MRDKNQLSDGRTYVDVTDSAGSMEDCQGHVVYSLEAGWQTCHVGKALVERTPDGEFEGKGLGVECRR